MSRSILPPEKIHPAIREEIASYHRDIVEQVKGAIATHDTVVVGMQFNPHVSRARKILDARGVPHEYLEFGGYLSEWRRRSALKMWTGWPSFPMVFKNGVLIGGADDLERLIDSGEFGM